MFEITIRPDSLGPRIVNAMHMHARALRTWFIDGFRWFRFCGFSIESMCCRSDGAGMVYKP